MLTLVRGYVIFSQERTVHCWNFFYCRLVHIGQEFCVRTALALLPGSWRSPWTVLSTSLHSVLFRRGSPQRSVARPFRLIHSVRFTEGRRARDLRRKAWLLNHSALNLAWLKIRKSSSVRCADDNGKGPPSVFQSRWLPAEHFLE